MALHVSRSRPDVCQIVTKERCTLIYGALEPHENLGLFSNMANGHILDPTLARMCGADHAFGHPDDTMALRQKMAPDLIAQAHVYYQPLRLSDEAITWIATGEHNPSSLAMFTYLTGVYPSNSRLFDHKAFPRDAIAFGCCHALATNVPEIRDHLHYMAALSTSWSRITSEWADLTLLLENQQFIEVSTRLSRYD